MNIHTNLSILLVWSPPLVGLDAEIDEAGEEEDEEEGDDSNPPLKTTFHSVEVASPAVHHRPGQKFSTSIKKVVKILNPLDCCMGKAFLCKINPDAPFDDFRIAPVVDPTEDLVATCPSLLDYSNIFDPSFVFTASEVSRCSLHLKYSTKIN